MAIRNDININWEVSPRIITIAAPSINISMQDLYDTLRSLEDDAANMDDDLIVSGSGKENLGGGVYVGLTVSLNNAQVAFEARSGPTFIQCNVTGGNLVASDISGDIISPIYSTAYTQVILTSSSSATLQELDSIQYASFNGGITIDASNGTTNTAFPAGTPLMPCKTISTALAIGSERGFNTLYIIGDLTLSYAEISTFTKGSIIGEGIKKTTITIENSIFPNAIAKNCTLQGTFGNGSSLECYNCELKNLYNISIDAHDCILSGIIELNDTISSNFYNCVDGIPGEEAPIVEVNDCENLGFWGYFGGIKLTNINTPGTNISVNINSGKLVVDSTDTEGNIIVRGIGNQVGTSGGTIIDKTGLIDKFAISEAAWDEPLTNHIIAGTTGRSLSKIDYYGSVYIDIINGSTGSSYPLGTRSYPVNNLNDAISIATTQNIKSYVINGDVSSNNNFTDVEIRGLQTIIDYTLGDLFNFNNYIYTNVLFQHLTLNGSLNGDGLQFYDCYLQDADGLSGSMTACSLNNLIKVKPGSYLSGVEMIMEGDYTTIDLQNTSGTTISLDINSGYLKIINSVPGCLIEVNLKGGEIELDESCSGGDFYAEGVGTLLGDPEALGFNVKANHLIALETIPGPIWDSSTADYQITGTMGKTISDTVKDTVKKIIPFLFAK